MLISCGSSSAAEGTECPIDESTWDHRCAEVFVDDNVITRLSGGGPFGLVCTRLARAAAVDCSLGSPGRPSFLIRGKGKQLGFPGTDPTSRYPRRHICPLLVSNLCLCGPVLSN
jgi:hypothetical protein